MNIVFKLVRKNFLRALIEMHIVDSDYTQYNGLNSYQNITVSLSIYNIYIQYRCSIVQYYTGIDFLFTN